MQKFLTDTCTDVKRWLPEPEWVPGWHSEAAGERTNRVHGLGGPWGPDPVRAVYTAAALYLEAVLQCARAVSSYLSVDSTQYVPSCLDRAAMEAGSQAFWLLEPEIGARRRVARFMLLRASGAWQQDEQIKKTSSSTPGSFGETRQQVKQLTDRYGLVCEFRPHKRRYGGEWWCEGEKMPSYSERNRSLEEAMFTAGAYSIYSSALHAEWHSVVGNWEEVGLEERNKGPRQPSRSRRGMERSAASSSSSSSSRARSGDQSVSAAGLQRPSPGGSRLGRPNSAACASVGSTT